jgi:hypothetical protein
MGLLTCKLRATSLHIELIIQESTIQKLQIARLYAIALGVLAPLRRISCAQRYR